MKIAALCLLLPFALLACDSSSEDDSFGVGGGGGGSAAPNTCETQLALTGSVDGSPMPSADDEVNSVWFNQSLDEYVLSDIDKEVMDELGLDADDQLDVERYRYLVSQADYRFLDAEDATDADGWPIRNKDVTVFYFDLTGHPADLDHPIAIFDLTPIEAAEDSGDRDALGDAIRVAADTIRDNGHPDVIVAYAADRSDEGIANVLVSLLSPHARYASGGQAWIHDVLPYEGDPVTTITPPLDTLVGVSIRVQASFPEAEDTMSIEATCLPVTMSG